MRSSATYFIPKPPAGKRVQSATLRVFTTVVSDPHTRNFSAIRLSGKSPTTVDTVSCFDGNLFSSCFGWVTWDFTAEARALAAQGGGELPLNLDPVPPVIFRFPGLAGSLANYTITPSVNYPWQHDHENGALTLTFEAECPKELKLKVEPSEVRPQIPPDQTLRPGVGALATKALVQVDVKSCSAADHTAPPIEVSFEVRPPTAGSSEAGGHLHDTRRREGVLRDPRTGQAIDRCVVDNFKDGIGSCILEYHPNEVSGVETIVARALDFADASITVTVKIPGLFNLAWLDTPFWNLTGDKPGLHTDNHWGTHKNTSNIQLVAKDFFDQFSAKLGINDLSLPWGGLYDHKGTWNPDHLAHRQGTSVDIDKCAQSTIAKNPNPACPKANTAGYIEVPKRTVGDLCWRWGRGTLAKEGKDPEAIHCEFTE